MQMARDINFLGYCERTKAYRLMYLQTKSIIKSRNVILMKMIWRCIQKEEIKALWLFL